MSADNDLNCTPAPASTEAAVDPGKTLHIRQDKGSPAGRKLAISLLLLAPIVGIVLFLAFRQGGSDAAAASTGAVVEGEGTAQGSSDAIEATEAIPPQCQAETVDPVVKWYCEEMHPAFVQNKADHARIDRLEAEVKRLKEEGAGPSGAPTWMVLLLIAIGLVTVFNTVQILSKKEKPPGNS
jgi:hypothetical protein